MNASATDRRIRALRPPTPRVDPWKAHGAAVDDERRPDGSVERALTVFLAGAECPFTCAFCDLSRYTIDGPTPPGAIPKQLSEVLRAVEPPMPARLKLYNASNFFDARAVPPGDLAAIAELARPFRGVTVECHASLVGERALGFASALDGRLEVAIGLETIHPLAMRRLNKRLTLERFERAARFLADHDIDLRVFVLLGAPFIPAAESVEWTIRAARHAATHGAAVVSLIPVRGGNGELERLQAEGEFTPPTLRQLEAALDGCLGVGRTAYAADLWDLERLPACATCRSQREQRLRRVNVSGHPEPPIACADCRPA